MSLRQEVEKILTDAVTTDPTWQKASLDRPIVVSGNVGETLQTLTNALTAYCDALLLMTLHIADAVDDLRGDAEV